MQIKKILLLLLPILCVPLVVHAIDYDAEDTVLFTGALSGLQNNQSTVGFFYWWNDFGGLIFLRLPETLGTPETVKLGIAAKICSKRLRGVYYSNQRGMRFRPLDQDTLTILQWLTWAYDTLTLTGWLFIGCNGSSDTYVYGDITHTRSGYDYELIAWTQLQFSSNQYSPVFAQTLSFVSSSDGGAFSGYLWDSYGWIGLVRWSRTACTDVRGSPNPNTVCAGVSFVQTSNCGHTQTAMWTKNCWDWILILHRDDCELPSALECTNDDGIDNSSSYYDNTCCAEYAPIHPSAPDCSLDGSTYSSELEQWYMYACNLAVTTKIPISEAEVMGSLLRKHLAKMISEFAIRKMWFIPDYQKPWCDAYTDVANEDEEMQFYIKTACQLELMWMQSDGTTPKTVFNPNDQVPRTEFGTVLSRMLFDGSYNVDNTQWETFYKNHLQALQDKWVMKYIDASIIFNPEIRWYVRMMLKRSDDLWLLLRDQWLTTLYDEE